MESYDYGGDGTDDDGHPRRKHDPSARREAELVLPQDAVVSGFAYEGPGDLASAQVLANQESGPQLQPTGRPHQGPGPGGVRWV